jgi:hypothetical protein
LRALTDEELDTPRRKITARGSPIEAKKLRSFVECRERFRLRWLSVFRGTRRSGLPPISVDAHSCQGAFGERGSSEIGLLYLNSREIGVFYAYLFMVGVSDCRPGELRVVEGGAGEVDIGKG